MWSTSFLLLLILFAWGATPSESNRECEEKEKSLALLELAKDSINKAKDLVPHCGDDIPKNETLNNVTVCGKKEKLEAYIDIAINLIDEAKESYPNCDLITNKKPDDKEKPDEEEKEKIDEEDKVLKSLSSDCLEVQQRGFNKSGVYTIQLQSVDARNKTMDVFCDMDTDGGGWTVIQRRGDFKPLENFYRKWKDYKIGFGNISRDFWIGNDNIFFLSSRSRTTIRFDLGDVDGNRAYAVYSNFSIESEVGKYRLHIEGYKGDAGDSMNFHNDRVFATEDNEKGSCAYDWKSGWWFANCYECNPNGLYQPGQEGDIKSATWTKWKGFTGLAFIEIKIKPFM